MGEEIASENGRISDFQGLVTLTLDRVIRHTAMHHSSTSTYMPNFIEIEETFCGRTDGQTFEAGFIRSTQRSRPKRPKKYTGIPVIFYNGVTKEFIDVSAVTVGLVMLRMTVQVNTYLCTGKP